MKSHIRATLMAFLFTLVIAACGATAPATPTALPTPAPTASPTSTPTTQPSATAAPLPTLTPGSAAVTITDAAGRKVTLTSPPTSIITLAPSATELVFALDLGSLVVAVDDFTDFPEEAKALPKIGGSNGIYNIEQIVAHNPDLVIAAGITPPEIIQKLTDLNLTVIVLGTAQTTMESIFSDISILGSATQHEAQATQLSNTMRKRLTELQSILARAGARPLVYWELDATDLSKPYSVGRGNFVDDVITLAGGRNIFANAESPFPQVSAEQIVAAKPDIIILADAAYGITIESVIQRPGWANIPAVQQKRIAPIDDNLVSRPGPRIIDGIEAAARIIHPELFK